MSKTLALQPRLTEKTYGLSNSKNRVYVMDVDRDLNKHAIKRAVESQFEVVVTGVNVVNNKGKSKRTIAKKGRKVYAGREAATKKAYVTLKAGQVLPFFDAIEEEEKKQEATQAKMEKAMEKQEAKEAKTEAKKKPSAKVDEKSAEPESPKHRFQLRGRRGKQEDK